MNRTLNFEYIMTGNKNHQPPIESMAYQMLIGGSWVEAKSGKRFNRKSPAHDVEVGTYPLADVTDTEAAIAAARQAFDEGPWPQMAAAEREGVLRKVAQLLKENAEELGRIETLESGKPISQAKEEVHWAASFWEYAASSSRHLYGDSYNALGEAQLGLVLREPIGVVGMVTPWNFPLLIASQKLPFALAAGCTAVIKPSELTSGTTLRLGKIMQEAGVPDGVVNVVTGYGDPVGALLSEHPQVDKISFTGSTAVGKKVMAAAQSNLKKVSLELGGKNPQIIFPDADLDAALDAVVFGIYFNMGECCNSGSRILLHKDIAKDFAQKIVERAKTVPVGDPLDEKVKVGAIINDTQRDKILKYIESGKEQGASIALGGKTLQTEYGNFIEPTVFEGATSEMEIAKEEIFGPVLSIIEFETVEEALQIANSTEYGLSAGVWTRNVDVAFQLSRKVRVGTVWINTFMDGSPELPFGGYKQSGLGRELGRFSIEEYTELKTVFLHLGPRTSWWHPAG